MHLTLGVAVCLFPTPSPHCTLRHCAFAANPLCALTSSPYHSLLFCAMCCAHAPHLVLVQQPPHSACAVSMLCLCFPVPCTTAPMPAGNREEGRQKCRGGDGKLAAGPLEGWCSRRRWCRAGSWGLQCRRWWLAEQGQVYAPLQHGGHQFDCRIHQHWVAATAGHQRCHLGCRAFAGIQLLPHSSQGQPAQVCAGVFLLHRQQRLDHLSR